MVTLSQGCFAGENRGEFQPPPNPPPRIPKQNQKIAKFWGGEHFPPKRNMNIIINIKLVSDKAYILDLPKLLARDRA